MDKPLQPLLTDVNDICVALRKRSKDYIEKSIRGKTKKVKDEKAELEAEDGWYVLRESKRSYRLGQKKKFDEILEDQVWCFFARSGFSQLSDGREFKIKVGESIPSRQIDVFAKDDEVAVCVECTTSEIPKKKRMTSLIEKVCALKKGVAQSINSQYGTSPKLKIRWVIATRNIEWSQPDLDRASLERIIVLRDSELDYFDRLTKQYKEAAKYQILAHLFSGESIKGLEISVPATKGKMGGKVFYNFLMRPKDLLKIAYVSHKASKDIEDLETYQRMLVPKRLKDISKYIDGGGQFPTNIVVNLKNNVRFDKMQKVGDSAFGILYLPDKYASAWIIDGQHRLYGYSHSEISKKPSDSTTLPVLAYEKLSPSDEANLFVDINCEQVRVTKNLLVEIYANLRWDSDVQGERIDALRSRVIMALEQKPTSPIKGRVITTSRHKTNYRCLTLTSFSDGLNENKFFGEERGGNFIPGLLSDSSDPDLTKTLKKSAEILSGYLKTFADAMPEHWVAGDSKEGYLCTNNGIRALLRVLKEILYYLTHNDHVPLYTLDAEETLELIEKYNRPVVDYFKNASSEEISIFRSRQALKGVRQNSLTIMSFINEEYEEFLPQGLAEYLDNIDVDGTKEAKDMIDEISRVLFKATIYELKRKYPNNEDWWYEGVPEKIRTSCSGRYEEDKGKKEKEQYVYLIDYRTIAMSNWTELGQYYAFERDGGKEKQTKWLVKLNDIRTVTHHAEKWPATKDQVSYVRKIYKKIIEIFPV